MTPDRQRFDAVWQRLIPGDPSAAFASLSAYGEDSRAYHNWRHVGAMLNGLDLIREEPEFLSASFDEIEVAIWFHDAIYKPLAKDNEAQSAALFKQMAGTGWLDQVGRGRIEAMILATAHHSRSDDLSTRLLLDLDLQVLGSRAEVYARYVRNVRTEYSEVPDDAWRTGRSAVLRQFLERSAIYQTAYFQERLERHARHNIEAEIAVLEA